jgi:ABC-2 type transport system permease protein
VPPVIQCLIFGYAASYDLTDIPYAVLDQDRSAASKELLARLDGSGVFRRTADVNRSADLKAAINDRQALLGIQIDQEFERRLQTGLPAEIQVLADGRNSNTAGTSMGYVIAIVDAFNADWRASHSLLSPSRGVQVTPFRPAEIMAGKAIPSVLIGMVQATAILLVAQLWFRIPFVGSFVTLYLGIALFLMAAVGIGLLVSSIAATMQQAMLYSFMVNMPFALLSGLTTPLSSMPEFLQKCTAINPLRYGIDIAHRVYLEGAGLDELIPDLWPLAVIATVTLSVASWMFRHRLT